MTQKVVKPIALDESLNTTEETPRNIADVLAEGLASLEEAVSTEAELPLKKVNGKFTNNGNLLTVTGNNAWAEGERTEATAGRAHAEGYMTKASAADAHAEGSNNRASGEASHAEGDGCTASGKASHAGGMGTRMSAQGGTSVGNFNSDDTALFVVGNGTDSNNRSDAFKVDSNGNAHITNESGNLVKVRGAGIATFNVTQTDVNTYVFPNESDVRTAIGNYDDVILRLAPLGGGFTNYILDHQAVAVGVGTKYTWVREDGSRVITLEGSGSPVVWTWSESIVTNSRIIYGSLQDAISDNANLSVGDIFETNGFNTSGDGGASRYLVSNTGTANGMDIIQLSNGKLAIFQWSDEVHPEQLGAYGDGTTDDTSIFNYIINMFSSVTRDMQVKRAIVGSFGKRYRVNDLYVHDCTLQRCVFYGLGSTVGIGLKLGSRAIIDRCILFNFKDAIYTGDGDSAISAVITGCTVSWCGNGINLSTGTSQQTSVDSILIEKNYISRMGTLGHSSDTTPPNWDNTGCGIWLNGNWKGVNIVDNVLEYNGFTGIRLECNRIDLEPSCTITENYLEGNKNSAIRIQMQNRPCAVSIFGNQMTKSDVNVFVTTGIFCTKMMSSGEVESPYGEFIGVATTNNGSSYISVNADNLNSSNIIIYPGDVVSNTFELTPAKCSNSKSSRKIFHLNLYARGAAALGLRITYKDKNGVSQTSDFSVTQNTASVIEVPLIDFNLYDATNSPITCEITSTLSDLFYIAITDMWIK